MLNIRGLAGGLGDGLTPAQCYAATDCRVVSDALCYGPGYFTDFCKTWRAFDPAAAEKPLAQPPTITPPVLDTDPNSPTYGQATVNGQPVATPEQAQILIDQQIAAQAAAARAATAQAMGQQAAATCAVLAGECGPLQAVNATCTACEFDPTKPLFIGLVFAAMAALIAFRK